MSETPARPSDDELERLRRAFAAPSASATAGEPTDPEQIWAAVHGELDAEQTQALVDRLDRDEQLALEWRLAVELGARTPELDSTGAGSEAPEPLAAIEPAANVPRYRYYAGVLAAAAAVVLIIVVQRPDEDPPGSTALDRASAGGEAPLRAGDPSEAMTTPITDGATLRRGEFELRWSAVPEAERYELRLSTEALDPIHRVVTLDSPVARIPAEAFDDLDAGSIVLWQVRALVSDGRALESAVWRVRVE